MRWSRYPVLVASSWALLAPPLFADCAPDDYFVGEVNLVFRNITFETQSTGKWTHFGANGQVLKTTVVTSKHRILTEDLSQIIANNTLSTSETYLRNIRGAATASTCYRAKLEVASACVAQGWGSSKVCAPDEPPPDGPPPTQPGDGTGDGPDPRPSTPIVIDLEGDGFRFTAYAAGASFDLSADGFRQWTAWTDPEGNEAFLALDRNANGAIDSGAELFGDHTQQPASDNPNGFAALAVYDQPAQGGNGDGLLSAADLIFPSLLLWRDINHDGVSQGTEMQPLSGSWMRAIDLDYVLSRRRDRHGNQLRWASRIQSFQGWELGAVDVIFATE